MTKTHLENIAASVLHSMAVAGKIKLLDINASNIKNAAAAIEKELKFSNLKIANA